MHTLKFFYRSGYLDLHAGAVSIFRSQPNFSICAFEKVQYSGSVILRRIPILGAVHWITDPALFVSGFEVAN
jgi:hypothetical protein